MIRNIIIYSGLFILVSNYIRVFLRKMISEGLA